MHLPTDRTGIGDDPGGNRRIVLLDGWLEFRIAPGFTAEILNIEVSNERRREGVGRLLVDQVVRFLQKLSPPPIKRLWVLTRSTNKIAREFYYGIGFRELATLHGFYSDAGDAVMFSRVI